MGGNGGMYFDDRGPLWQQVRSVEAALKTSEAEVDRLRSRLDAVVKENEKLKLRLAEFVLIDLDKVLGA